MTWNAWATRVRAVATLVDAHDLHFYGGLLLAAGGGVLVSVRWTLVCVGAVLARVGFVLMRGTR